MKVLAICASPRKGGNSDVVCDQFLKGAADCGNVIKKINLAEKNISPCVACYGCTKSHHCVKMMIWNKSNRNYLWNRNLG